MAKTGHSPSSSAVTMSVALSGVNATRVRPAVPVGRQRARLAVAVDQHKVASGLQQGRAAVPDGDDQAAVVAHDRGAELVVGVRRDDGLLARGRVDADELGTGDAVRLGHRPLGHDERSVAGDRDGAERAARVAGEFRDVDRIAVALSMTRAARRQVVSWPRSWSQ